MKLFKNYVCDLLGLLKIMYFLSVCEKWCQTKYFPVHNITYPSSHIIVTSESYFCFTMLSKSKIRTILNTDCIVFHIIVTFI